MRSLGIDIQEISVISNKQYNLSEA